MSNWLSINRNSLTHLAKSLFYLNFYDLCSMCCAERPVYSRRDVVVGQFVELVCNTSLTSNISWTYDTDDGYVDDVYWNGELDSDKPRLATVQYAVGRSHSLVIRDAELNDSGLYNCYDGEGLIKAGYQLDGEGLRKAGYQLIVAGMNLYIVMHYVKMLKILFVIKPPLATAGVASCDACVSICRL